MNFTADELQAATGGKWLQATTLTVDSVKTDSRENCAGALFLAIAGEKFDAHDFLASAVQAGAAALCVNHSSIGKLNPDWDIPVLAVLDTIVAYQAIARHHKRRLPGLKTVAVTGSMGKTSVKEIIRAILIAEAGADAVHATVGNTNNQIGVPQNLLMLTAQHRYAVIEMGTNHHGEIEPLSRCAEPDVAVICSIGPCHLEHLGDLDGVAREKSKIFAALNSRGTAVIPAVTPGLAIISESVKSFKQLRFGKENAEVKATYLGGKLHGSTVKLAVPGHQPQVIEWPLSGAHQAFNAAAAAAAAVALGIGMEAIAAGLANCKLPGMRMKISEIGGNIWINDAYNANPGSMLAALAWLAEFASQEKLVPVLGDMLELGPGAPEEHRRVIAAALETFPSARLVLVGPQMTAAAKTFPPSLQVHCFPDAASAVEPVRAMLRPGDMVFLKGSRGTHLEVIETQS